MGFQLRDELKGFFGRLPGEDFFELRKRRNFALVQCVDSLGLLPRKPRRLQLSRLSRIPQRASGRAGARKMSIFLEPTATGLFLYSPARSSGLCVSGSPSLSRRAVT